MTNHEIKERCNVKKEQTKGNRQRNLGARQKNRPKIEKQAKRQSVV